MKRLTARAALDAWPERLAEVRVDPTDDNLQRLCCLIDAVDGWVVQRWGTAGHDERRAQLSAMRVEAREANRQVSVAQRTPSHAQMAALDKARTARDRRSTVPKRLVTASGATDTNGPAAT